MAPTEQDKAQALSQIRAVYEDGTAEINGHDYTFTRMKHKQRRKVFAFYTGVAHQLKAGDFAFLDSERFDAVEKIVEEAVLFNGVQLCKQPEHWDKDEYAGDYLKFIALALGVISYPFLSASSGS